jgi:hypothetical protein
MSMTEKRVSGSFSQRHESVDPEPNRNGKVPLILAGTGDFGSGCLADMTIRQGRQH